MTPPEARISEPYPCGPLRCTLRWRASAIRHHCTVTSATSPPSERPSSTDQPAEQWSSMTRRDPLATVTPSTSAPAMSPGRKRRWRTTTSWVRMATDWPRKQMPPPGAVWPATVRNGSVTTTGVSRVTSPPTRKTTVRGPVAATASRKLPGPRSSRVVTKTTRPPRPAGVEAPKPSAPGKAGGDPRATQGAKRAQPTIPARTAARPRLVRLTIDIVPLRITDSRRRRGPPEPPQSSSMARIAHSQSATRAGVASFSSAFLVRPVGRRPAWSNYRCE